MIAASMPNTIFNIKLATTNQARSAKTSARNKPRASLAPTYIAFHVVSLATANHLVVGRGQFARVPRAHAADHVDDLREASPAKNASGDA